MPKSRKRKKSPKQRAVRPVTGAVRQPAVWTGPKATESNGDRFLTPFTQVPQGNSKFLRVLYQNDGEALFQFVSLFPLLLGTWAAGGLFLHDFNAFSVVLGLLFVAQLLDLVGRRRVHFPFFEQTYLLFYAAIIGLVAGFYYITESAEGLLLLSLLAVLFLATPRLELNSKRAIVLQAISQMTEMGLLAVTGAFCQSKQIVLSTAVLGIVPGSLLAAVIIAKNAALLEKFGWSRSFEVSVSDGIPKTTRPGGVTRLYTLALILGPSTPGLLLPFQALPDILLLGVLPLYFMPNMATAFLRREHSDQQLAFETLQLALFSVLCMLIAVQLGWI